VAIEPFENVETCGQRGQDENRMVLTRGMKRYSILARFVDKGSCLAIKSGILEDQVSCKMILKTLKLLQSISIKVLVREKKIRNRKKKEPQKLFLAKLNTKPLKLIKMGAG